MSYLLDTHALIWAITEPRKLSASVRAILENTDNDIVVSAVSFWEIALKHRLKKLTLEGITPQDFPQAATETGFRLLDLDAATASSYHQLLAVHHRDPFDRMLIWQALQYNFQLVSRDEMMKKYGSDGLQVVW